jgi:hypothetical protein
MNSNALSTRPAASFIGSSLNTARDPASYPQIPRTRLKDKNEDKELVDAVTEVLKKAERESRGERAELFLKFAQKMYAEDKESAESRAFLTHWLLRLLAKAAGEKKQELLEELRKLSEEHPDDALVREQLAIAWVNDLAVTHGAKAAQLLQSVRRLYQTHSDDAEVRKQFAMGLLYSMSRNLINNEPKAAMTAFDEFDTLRRQYDDDPFLMELQKTLERVWQRHFPQEN